MCNSFPLFKYDILKKEVQVTKSQNQWGWEENGTSYAQKIVSPGNLLENIFGKS